MPLGTEVGHGPGDIVLDGEPALPSKMVHSSPPHFSAHVLVPNGLIKMPLGTEVGLGPGHIVLHGDPATPQKRAQQLSSP